MLRQAKKIKKVMTRFIRDERGGMITLTAFMLPMIFGFAGMGLDATSWYTERRNLQNMADMGALDGAHSSDYYTGTELTALVKTLLSKEGYDATTDTVVVSHPPISGDHVGDMGFVEVNMSRAVNMYMLSGFYALRGEAFAVNVATRAVAGDVVTGTQCIVALDPSADQAMYFSGTADVDADCGVASNSTSGTAIYVQGNATLTADPAQAVGDIWVRDTDNLITTSPIQTYAPAVEDPYEGLDIPITYQPCDSGDPNVHEGGGSPNDMDAFGEPREISPGVPALDANGKQYVDFKPGRYCGGLNINTSTQHAVFLDNDDGSPGKYILDGGDFKANAQAVISGENITFFFTADVAEDIGSIDKINGGVDLTLTAPTEDGYDFKGILFYQDERAPDDNQTAWFNGGSNMKMDGALYFPSSTISFLGGAEADPACLQIIGKKLKFSGEAVIGNDAEICESLGLKDTFQMIRVVLVE